jgi:hypothetical protein
VTGAPVPPQNLEAEESLLGAMMVSPNAITTVAEIIDPGDFYRESHARIFRAAVDMHRRGIPVDEITLIDELEERGDLERIGGRARIHELGALVPASANAGHYARVIGRKAREREQLAVATAAERALLNGGLEPELQARIVSAFSESTTSSAAGESGIEPVDLSSLLAGALPQTAWLWHGWLARGELALIVADPKTGKSLTALGLAAAIRNGERFLAADTVKSRVGIIDFENPIGEVHKRLRAFGIAHDDHHGIVYFHMPLLDLTSPEAAETITSLIRDHRLDLLIIDSVRRAAPGLDENDSRSVSAVFSPLRRLSVENDCAIVAIHHARKRIGDNPTDAGQMVRGSGDLLASVDTLFYLRAKENSSFTLETVSRRGLPHEPILVRIEGDDDQNEIRLVNEGPVALAEDKVEAMLAKIVQALRDDGGAQGRPALAVHVGTDPKNGTFNRALNLGWQRGQLAKTAPGKVGEPTLYALATVNL